MTKTALRILALDTKYSKLSKVKPLKIIRIPPLLLLIVYPTTKNTANKTKVKSVPSKPCLLYTSPSPRDRS